MRTPEQVIFDSDHRLQLGAAGRCCSARLNQTCDGGK